MFSDYVVLSLIAGNGGDGIIAWKREKYLPNGGPIGGNGGSGGSILFQSNVNLSSLEKFNNKKIIKAKNGEIGKTDNRTGRSAQDLILQIPIGTLIKDFETNNVLYDFQTPADMFQICAGGSGGKGNLFFKTSTNQAPYKYTKGKAGETKKLILELKILADIGLIGFPNAGKSSFLNKITNNTKAKIANYPFTTLTPNIGIYTCDKTKRVTIADIPGIIKNAHNNKGLGLKFLKHIERTKKLFFILDITEQDPLKDFEILQNELNQYNKDILKTKSYIIILNKIDLYKTYEHIFHLFKQKYPSIPIFAVSIKETIGIFNLKKELVYI